MKHLFYIILILNLSSLSGQNLPAPINMVDESEQWDKAKNNKLDKWESHEKYYETIGYGLPNKIIISDTVTSLFADSIRDLAEKNYGIKLKKDLVYYADYYKNCWAIYNLDKTWVRIPIPFGLGDSAAALINIDNKGFPELIIKPEYSSYGTQGNGHWENYFLVFNLESSPVLIMSLKNHCFTQYFSERIESERKIKIKNKGVTIGAVKGTPKISCVPTQIPSGHYKLINGKFIRQKLKQPPGK